MAKDLDEARGLVNQYAAKYGGEYALGADAHQRFMRLCEFAYVFADEFGSSSVDIQVSPPKTFGEIRIDVDGLVFEHGRSHPFFERIKDADCLAFSNAENETLLVTFRVDNLWVVK